jgi:photosystem II stability/assembly factor-like uncharacterized protein
MDPSDPDTVYAGTTVGLFVSRDAGHSWTRLFGDVVVNAVVVEPSNPEVIIVGADDVGVLRSVDGGETFAPANSGFVHRQIAALEADPREPSTFYAAVAADGPHGGLFVARDLGREWTPFNEGLDPTGSSIGSIRAGSHSREVFLGTMRGVFRGIPGIQPWRLVDSTTRMWIKDLDFADREQTALALATQDGLFRLDLHSERVERWMIPVYDGAVHGVILDKDSDALFAATDMGVFRLDQGETAWRIKAIGLPPIRVNLVARGGKRLFCGTSQGVFFSDDDAETWNRSPESPVFDIVRIRANPENPSEVYALDATSLFLFQSRDGGLNWEQVAWFDRARVSQVAFVSSGRLLAGTMAEGVYLVDSLPLSANGNEE